MLRIYPSIEIYVQEKTDAPDHHSTVQQHVPAETQPLVSTQTAPAAKRKY